MLHVRNFPATCPSQPASSAHGTVRDTASSPTIDSHVHVPLSKRTVLAELYAEIISSISHASRLNVSCVEYL
ncbi:hypothetical protein K504DRAFT_456897 [Pleomassaria siparia CBS 279.74]|uniref:Uncharacterized protein n=1 Tax=Pleomassaria siparia CBS 279.74 TaxID=1314801 RepID=A0A6G1KPG8_9PLEO|nr:hypothetical protein K504DRAFT_456897 [Pleomassaria siparia CBS 279.74]